jgi:type IV pilus assembly protein PilY1
MISKHSIVRVAAGILGAICAGVSSATPSPFVEDFVNGSTTNNWYYFNGACLTAGTTAGTGTAGANGILGTPGQIPGCINILSSYYQQQQDKDKTLVGGYNGNLASGKADPLGNGALRFTNGSPYGHAENGAIVSATTFDASQGVHITFKTVTYLGDSGGAGKDGADGMSFYLLDASQSLFTPGNGIWNGIGSWGGSLAYTCSNANPPYTGLVGAYLGLGIDEFGNFLNGVSLEPGFSGATASGDNTAIGYGYVPQRIGLRGYGNVAWTYLNNQYPSNYPSTLTSAQQQAAVQNTCKTGTLWNYANAGSPKNTGTTIADYAPILGAYSVLPAGTNLAVESAATRGKATPIVYDLVITQNNLLSFKYSINGGAYTQVIKGQNITTSNEALPSSLQFGFAGSTGGDTNIHEILCFKATPVDTSASSASTDQQQTGKVQTSTQAYFSFYDPNDWTGRLTAFGLVNTNGTVSINPLANWDAECVLTGVATTGSCLTTGVAGSSSPQGWTSPTPAGDTTPNRVMLTWNGLSTAASPGTAGISFSGPTVTAAELTALGDSSPNYYLLHYLRGERANEIPTSGPTGTKIYRTRDGVLADIIDSSPTWVGPPASPYSLVWTDRLYPSTTMQENLATQTYAAFQSSNQSRLNVVYVGANDGFMHGFRTGSEDVNGNVINTPSTPNDGAEVLAYMPGAILNTIHNASNSALDFSNPQYAHNFFVDATPATGDLFYNGAWHTWLLGGLGAGGAAIYALDITNPTAFTEANAANVVKGEWSSATITCVNVSGCGNNLGNTYGTPQIRRFHNGNWGAVFGNGFGSTSGDAGIYVMTVSEATGAVTFYYLSTGVAGGNGIAFAAPADLDGDHITDYVYAGDLKGNIWRFDLTSSNPNNWALTPGPLFQTASGQPITTQLVLAAGTVSGTLPSLMVAFGTGQRTQFTTTSSTTYVSGTQSLYGVWDWNFGAWNAMSAATYSSLTGAQVGSATTLTSPYTLGPSNLQQQSYTVNASTGVIDTSNTTIKWEQCASGTNPCPAGSFGWYAPLPGTNLATNAAGAQIDEQIVSNPSLFESALLVNSTIEANNSILSCTQSTDTGVTYIVSVLTGGTFMFPSSSGSGSSNGTLSSAFVNYHDANMAGLLTNETGALSVVTTTQGTTTLIGQYISPTITGSAAGTTTSVSVGGATQFQLPPNTTVNRVTWVELR